MINKEVLISAYSCCPNRGSEPGNGWSWILNYYKLGFSPIVVTSGKYKSEIDRYLKESSDSIEFVYLDTPSSLKALSIPVLGIYIHYYIWLYRSRHYINSQKSQLSGISHYHHVTYSSIKFGTPLYELQRPIVIGPIGGSSNPHKSLRAYFGKYWFAEIVKQGIAAVLTKINPTIRKSIKSSSITLVSNREALDFIAPFAPKRTIKMFDAGLSEYFRMDFHRRSLEGETINLLWVGRILPRKGLNLAIAAFDELLKSNTKKDYRFYIAGVGPLELQCKELVKVYGLQDNVIFLGMVSHSELVNHYKNAHLFLFPSLKDSCPMQVFEAMSTGLPVVTLDHQGMADQVSEENGCKIPVTEGVNYPKSLSEGIASLVSNEEEYHRRSWNAYQFGQQQIWSTRINRFVDNMLVTSL